MVFDRSGRRIRGLWQRNGSFYVQTMVVDAVTGLKKLNRIRLNGAANRTDATQAMYDLFRRIKDGEIITRKTGPDFKTYREHYKQVIGKAAKTLKKEDNCLLHWERFLGADMKIGNITSRQILAYRGKMLERELSPRTVNLHLKALRGLLKLARTEKYLSKLPTEGIALMKERSVERKLFSTDDLLRLGTEALRNHRRTGKQFSDFLLVCMYSGGRMSEVLNLKWENVDWQNQQLVFQGDTTKNCESRRVDFNANLQNQLMGMRANAPQDAKFLFPSFRTNKPITSFKKIISDIRRDLGMPDFSIHLTRHYFISTCVMNGLDYLTIARWVGHRDGGILIGRTYGHLHREHMQRMAKKLTF